MTAMNSESRKGTTMGAAAFMPATTMTSAAAVLSVRLTIGLGSRIGWVRLRAHRPPGPARRIVAGP